MTRFDGRSVVVVGGAGGIGSRIVARFIDEGASVVVIDTQLYAATDPATSVVRSVIADVADKTEVAAAMEVADSELGDLNVVVNAAGILRLGPLLETSVDEWHRVMNVNALGTMLVMQEAARRMCAGRGGRIVNIASMAAKAGGEDEAAYAASKAAVVALTRVAALEWGSSGITVNSICPGYIPTAMGSDTRTDDDVARWSALSPLGRLGTTDEVASVALFLASDEARYMTGQAINVTGGMIMH